MHFVRSADYVPFPLEVCRDVVRLRRVHTRPMDAEESMAWAGIEDGTIGVTFSET